MRDFCVEQEETSDILAYIGEILGEAGVNIEGLCLISCDGLHIIHFVVEDSVTARCVLEKSGIRIRDESEVFILHKDAKCVTGKPGSFGGICRTLADHDIKIKFGYPAENNRFVLGVDDVVKASILLK
jgi:hypothetical protein